MVPHGPTHTLSRRLALSAVHRGVAYEERSMALLQARLSMSLRRIGGRADGGVDLQGWWWLPSDDDPATLSGVPGHRRLRVLAQCKAESKKMGPKYIREMEGVLHRYHAMGPFEEPGTQESRSVDPAVGLMISSSSFSKAAALLAHSSPLPLILMYIPEYDPLDENAPQVACEDPEEQQIPGFVTFNPALAAKGGLLRGEFEVRWEYQAHAPAEGRLGLWWKGKRVESWTPDVDQEDL
ncbi:hypothetical protein PsYK624_025010 [Phanerochaete sordida]|uniref:Restriction endonuclease type IV Mrr domain-containing protein n=1 Tax=Phanerochaete sordida TaxID=48140 RepID=A0A9P3G1A9_9APHY|nr:hypothetical protein PsYK624_025010 [Phanerochaete sordida]